MKKTSTLKVSVSGVRGVVGESLTPALVADFAASFGRYVGGGLVVVGRDTRSSGIMMERAVIAGLLSVGCQPLLIGIVPTPTVQVIVDYLNANGGIAITASHNPSQWNALKFVGSCGTFLNSIEATELLDIYNQPENEYVIEDDIREVHYLENAFKIHKDKIFDNIDVDLIKRAKFKVAVDCCNGAGAPFSREFLEELGCEVITLFDDVTIPFQRTPEPIEVNISELKKAVKSEKCDIGFAQDPDADRITIVDNNGEFIGEQYSVVLASDHILSKNNSSESEPASVVANLATTKAIADVAKKYGAKFYFTKIGEINVTADMLKYNAIIGGEGSSGGVIFPAVHPCRDSFVGMALILEMMAMREAKLTSILSEIPKYYTANRKKQSSANNALKIVRFLRNKYSDLNPITLDGIRLDWDDKWVLIRPSNTEPVIRVIAEALSQGKVELLADEFEKLIDEF